MQWLSIMKDIHTREQFKALVQKMVGLTLSEVLYYEIEYEKPGYAYQPDIGHFLDFGLDLVADDGKCFAILWDSTFFQFGLGVYRNSAKELLRNTHWWTVTNDSQWQQFIGKTIESAEIYWSWVAGSLDAPEETRTYYPQDIVLTFSNNRRIYVSASEYEEKSDSVCGLSDNVMVVFSDCIASKYQLAQFATNS